MNNTELAKEIIAAVNHVDAQLANNFITVDQYEQMVVEAVVRELERIIPETDLPLTTDQQRI